MRTHYEGNSYPYGCTGRPFGTIPEDEAGVPMLWVNHLICLEGCSGADDLEDAPGSELHSQWIRLPN